MQRIQSTVRRWVSGFPLIVWLLGLGCFLNVGGLSLLWPVNAIYIHGVLGKPLTVAGLVLAVYSGAGFVGSFLGGWLYDRIGATRVLVLGLVFSSGIILVPVFSQNWYSYIAVMALFGITCAIPFPVLNALVGHAWPEGGRRAYNFLYVANNLGVAAGTAIGGVIAQWSFQAVFIGICVVYLLFVILLMTVFRKEFAKVSQYRRKQTTGVNAVPAHLLPRIPWVPIGVLFIGFILAWSVYVQWQSTISVFIQSLGYPLSWYSVLWTLNGLLIFSLQPIISVIVRRFPSLGAHMIFGTALYAVAYLLLIGHHAYPFFVVAMVIMTIGELFVWPSVPAAVTVLSPEHRLGMLQGLVGGAATLGRMIGPVIGGILYDHVTMNTLFTIFSIGTIVPAACFIVFHRLYHHSSHAVAEKISA